ncbi:hypothetical protein BD410DRAFT_845779 [Rickenella mellea]|uniref:DUF6532 domain-containing protein n=1 Tax=Rickenella mellea TaxID=50990 RepID=A0A4Y7PH00_9AGAM|nr:hypothetical protein BD410DRAFT_845779 [Rickenella mellea]
MGCSESIHHEQESSEEGDSDEVEEADKKDTEEARNAPRRSGRRVMLSDSEYPTHQPAPRFSGPQKGNAEEKSQPVNAQRPVRLRQPPVPDDYGYEPPPPKKSNRARSGSIVEKDPPPAKPKSSAKATAENGKDSRQPNPKLKQHTAARKPIELSISEGVEGSGEEILPVQTSTVPKKSHVKNRKELDEKRPGDDEALLGKPKQPPAVYRSLTRARAEQSAAMEADRLNETRTPMKVPRLQENYRSTKKQTEPAKGQKPQQPLAVEHRGQRRTGEQIEQSDNDSDGVVRLMSELGSPTQLRAATGTPAPSHSREDTQIVEKRRSVVPSQPNAAARKAFKLVQQPAQPPLDESDEDAETSESDGEVRTLAPPLARAVSKGKSRLMPVVTQDEDLPSDKQPPRGKPAARQMSVMSMGSSQHLSPLAPNLTDQINKGVRAHTDCEIDVDDLYGDTVTIAEGVEDVLQQHQSRSQPVAKKRGSVQQVLSSSSSRSPSVSDHEQSQCRGREQSQRESSRTNRRRQSKSPEASQKRKNTGTAEKSRRKRGRSSERESSDGGGRRRRRKIKDKTTDNRRKGKRSASTSPDSSDEDDHRHGKARGRKKGRKAENPRLLGYYTDDSRAWIVKAKEEFKCNLSLNTPFPTATEQIKMAKAAFKVARPGSKGLSAIHTTMLMLIVKSGTWGFRGALKAIAKSVVQDAYRWKPPKGHCDKLKGDLIRDPDGSQWDEEVVKYKALAACELLKDSSFTIGKCGTPYFHAAIGELIKVTWFTKRNGLGLIYKTRFRSMPLSLVALACCSIRNVLDCYDKGKDVSFDAETYRPYYDTYMANLMAFSRHPTNGPRLDKLRLQIFESGCKAVGVSANQDTSNIAPWIPPVDAPQANTYVVQGLDREPQRHSALRQVDAANSSNLPASRTTDHHDVSSIQRSARPEMAPRRREDATESSILPSSFTNDRSPADIYMSSHFSQSSRPPSDFRRNDTRGSSNYEHNPSHPGTRYHDEPEALYRERHRSPPRTLGHSVPSRSERWGQVPRTWPNATAGPSGSRRSPSPHYVQEEQSHPSTQGYDFSARSPSWGRSTDVRDGERWN